MQQALIVEEEFGLVIPRDPSNRLAYVPPVHVPILLPSCVPDKLSRHIHWRSPQHADSWTPTRKRFSEFYRENVISCLLAGSAHGKHGQGAAMSTAAVMPFRSFVQKPNNFGVTEPFTARQRSLSQGVGRCHPVPCSGDRVTGYRGCANCRRGGAAGRWGTRSGFGWNSP